MHSRRPAFRAGSPGQPLVRSLVLTLVASVLAGCGQNPGASVDGGGGSGGGGGDGGEDVPDVARFQPATYEVNEGDGSVLLTVHRSAPGDGALDLEVAFEGGTAQAGIDFTAADCAGAFDYADGETGNKTCSVPIIDRDGAAGGDTGFSAILSKVSGADTLEDTIAEITIRSQAPSGLTFGANSPPDDPIIPGAAGFGFYWDPDTLPDFHWYEVNTLSSGSGPGTYRDAITGSFTGCRLTYFSVSGTIDFPLGTILTANNDCNIVAFQTAPDPGILVAGAKHRIRASKFMLWHGWFAQKQHDNPGNAITDVIEWNGAESAVRDGIFMNSMAMYAQDENLSTYQDVDRFSIYQSIIGYGADEHGFGVLIGSGTPPANIHNAILRTLFGLNRQRNPLFRAAGSCVNNVSLCTSSDSCSQLPGSTAAGIRINYEDSVFIRGQSAPATALYVAPEVPCSVRVFRNHPDANVLGLNGFASPPGINNSSCDEIFDQATARYPGSYPTGYSDLTVGSTTPEKQEFIRLVAACAGPRPLARHPVVKSFIDDEMLAFGTSTTTPPMTAGPIPTLAQNSIVHADLPADPNAPGTSPYGAGIDWLVAKHYALVPTGKGCN